MLETSFPRIKGDVGNPDTFDFPVHYEIVKGASPERIVLEADKNLVDPFICAGKKLIGKGVKIITTSCGFLALFHQELTEAFNVNLESLVTKDFFESRLDARLSEQNATINTRFAELESKVDSNHRIFIWTQAIIMAAVIIPYLERLMAL